MPSCVRTSAGSRTSRARVPASSPATTCPASKSYPVDRGKLGSVGGLDQAVTQQTLFHAFLPFGDIVEVNLPKPENQSQGDQHRGFGYVEFETATDATDAIDNMDRSELYGSVIKVAAAKPQKDANEGLGSKTAIWEQVCNMLLYMCDFLC